MEIEDQLRLAVRNDSRAESAIATAVGIHPVTMSRFLNGKQSLTLGNTAKLAKTMKMALRLVPEARQPVASAKA